jgi:branched-chain amino acid transport system permease protein
MRRGSLVAFGIALMATSLLLMFLHRTRAGRAVRSVIQDETGARLVGIDPARVRTLVFCLSGALAGLYGVTQSMTAPVTVTAGFGLTTLALIVTVVGGLGSVRGALWAGVLLGIVNALASFYIGAYLTSITLLATAAATIVIRPSGIFGGRV